MNRVKLPSARSTRDAINALHNQRRNPLERARLNAISEIFREAGTMPWENHNTVKIAPRGNKK